MTLTPLLLDCVRAQIKHEHALARHERRRADRALNVEQSRTRLSRSVRHAERAKLLQRALDQITAHEVMLPTNALTGVGGGA